MAGLIKNQILKHLSKFAKNLSNDQLRVSTFKGHGELNNLELDEKVLTELLELPAWLRLTRATCNHVTLKIHWTKLKSEPIHLSLDEVVVVMETCEDLRPPTPLSSDHSYNTGGKYGFSDRVIDGMTVVVNSIVINFSSPTFQASFQLSRVVLESYSPDWKKKDLRLSRIKDADRGELLLFKRLEWQVLRIEAKSRENDGNQDSVPLTPLRLITNQACCKMTIKKKLADCTVVGSRLVFIMDDLLWVLTDAQLVAALHFLQSLSGLIKKATHLTQKAKAKRKIEQQPDKFQHQTKSMTRLSPMFNRNDVIETSYHVLCSRIDLHLCDDMDPKDGRSQHPNLKGGGAVQVSLLKLVMDYYPYHRAFTSRDHWLRYTEPSTTHNDWTQQLLSLFNDRLQTKGYSSFMPDGKAESPKHAPLVRLSSLSTSSIGLENSFMASPVSPDDRQPLTRKPSTPSSNSETVTQDTPSRKNTASRKLSLQQNYRYLMTSCFILRLEDIIAYKVATSSTTRKHAIEKFLIYNKHAHLPSEIKTLHLEHTTYYLPGDLEYPVPSPNLFLYFGPLKLYLDTATVLWINAFSLNLKKCLMSIKVDTFGSDIAVPVNIRVEALMPQVVIASDQISPSQPDRPKSLQLQSSRVVISNCRVGENSSTINLKECLNALNSCNVLEDTTQFPWDSSDKKPIAEEFLDHVLEMDLNGSPYRDFPKGVISESTNIWSIHLDPFWAEFTICESGRTRLQPFIDPLPLTLWCYNADSKNSPVCDFIENAKPSASNGERMFLHGLQSFSCSIGEKSFNRYDSSANEDNEADMYVLLHVESLVGLQLSHLQYLFLLRSIDSLMDMVDHLERDKSVIIKDKPLSSVCFVTWVPRVEVSLVLKSLNQMSATSESVDLASLQEDCSSNSDLPFKGHLATTGSSYSITDYCKNSTKPCSSNVYMDNGVPKSRSDSLLNCHSSGSSQSASTPVLTNPNEFPTEPVQRGLQSGASVMKRGFHSLVASIDYAFTKTDGHSLDEISYTDDDALSMKSDLSSDFDQFVLVNQDGSLDDEFFPHVNQEVDVAVEAMEESISNYTLNSEKKKEMVSVATFRCNHVGMVMQSQLSTCIIVKCNGVETKEEAAISWENFQTLFTGRSRAWKSEKKSLSRGISEISIRFIKDESENLQESVADPRFLSVLARNLHIPLFMSNVSALVEFFEDEVASKPLPSKIVLSDLSVILKDDGPSMGLSPHSQVLTICLPGCVLERTITGSLHMLPMPDGYIKNNLNCLLSQTSLIRESALDVDNINNSSFANCANASTSIHAGCDTVLDDSLTALQLMKENEKLRNTLQDLSYLQLENEQLKEEVKILKRINANELNGLENQKQSLQDTIISLQNEINILEMKRKLFIDK